MPAFGLLKGGHSQKGERPEKDTDTGLGSQEDGGSDTGGEPKHIKGTVCVYTEGSEEDEEEEEESEQSEGMIIYVGTCSSHFENDMILKGLSQLFAQFAMVDCGLQHAYGSLCFTFLPRLLFSLYLYLQCYWLGQCTLQKVDIDLHLYFARSVFR